MSTTDTQAASASGWGEIAELAQGMQSEQSFFSGRSGEVSTDQMIKDIAQMKGRLPSVIRTVLDVTKRDIPEELLRRLAPRGREGDAQVRSRIMSRYSQTDAFQKFAGQFSDPGELAYMTYSEMKDILMRKDELMNHGLSEADALAQIAQEKKDASARTAEELAEADPNFGAATATSSEPKNTRQGSLNGYRPATMASVFGGPAWGELLKKVVAGEAVPDRAAAIALMGGEGQANISKFGINAIAALGQGAQGYKTFQTAYDRLKSLGAVKLAGEYMKAAASGGVLNNEYGNGFATTLERAQSGQLTDPVGVLGVLGDYQRGDLGKKGVQSAFQTAGVKGMNGVLQEIDRRNSAIMHAPADERGALVQQAQEYMARAASNARFGKESGIHPEALEEMGKAASRVTDHLDKFKGGLKDATELIGKNQVPKGLGKLKSDYEMIAQLVKAADRGDTGAQGILAKNEKPLRGVAEGYGQLDDQMKRAMLEGKGEFNPDGPLGKRVGHFINEITSGFELFRMQRVWGMTGAPTFNQFIPAAANDALALSGASRAIGGERMGALSGMAGELVHAEAMRKDININAGRRAYQAWGPMVNANAGLFADAQAIGGPAVGAGAIGGFGAAGLAGMLGFGALALPVGLAVGGTIALAGLDMAQHNIAQAESRITPENQIKNLVEFSARNPRQLETEIEGIQSTRDYAQTLSGFNLFGSTPLLNEYDTQIGKRRNALAAQPLRAVSLASMPGEYIPGTIAEMSKTSANQGMFIGYDQEAMKKKIQAVAPYDAEAMAFRPGQDSPFLGTSLMNQLESSALGYEGALQLAQNVAGKYSLHSSRVSGIARAQPTDMESILDYIYKTDFFAPAQRWGMTPLQASMMPIFQGRDANRVQGLMSGDPLTLSSMAQQLRSGNITDDWVKQMAPWVNQDAIKQMMTVNPETGMQIGTDWGGMTLLRQQPQALRSYWKHVAGSPVQMDYRGDTGAFSVNNQSYAFTERGLQQANFDVGVDNQRFALGQNQRRFDLQSAFTTGRGGLMGTGAGGEFTTGGPVTIKIGGQARIVTDSVTGQPISGRGQWQLEDWGRAISRLQQQQGFAFQQEGMGLSDRFFRERQALSRDQFNADIGRQRESLGANLEKMRTQYGWQREDLAFQGAQSSLQYSWGQEDISEALRYATGRERRQLLKRQERETVQFAMGMGKLDTESGRIDQRQRWDEEEFNRQKRYFDETMTFRQREMDLALRQHNEEMGLSQRQLDASRGAAREQNKLQDEATRQSRAYWTLNAAEEQAQLVHQAKMLNTQVALNAMQVAMAVAQQNQQANMLMLFQKDGPLEVSIKDLADRIKVILNAVLPGETKTIPFKNSWDSGDQ